MSASGECKFGYEEYDGSRFCHEHAGRRHAGAPPWSQCDEAPTPVVTPSASEGDS